MAEKHLDKRPSVDHDPESLDSDRDSLELQRIHTSRLQQQVTVGSVHRPESVAAGHALIPMGAGKPYPPQLPHPEAYIVEFDGADDPLHPQNWPMRKRLVLSLFSLVVVALV